MAYSTITKPSLHFNTNLWTSDDSNPRSITSTHATDFVWIKSRNQTYIHRLFDSVRGATKRLRSNGTDAEDTASNEVTGFTSTGYTINSGLNSTSPTTNWVGWSWLAGGTASSNYNGSITSSVSANTTAGFSIVSYTGNLTDGATVGHGLGVAPDMMIIKNRSDTQYWVVYHKDLGGANYHLRLDDTAANRNDLNMFSSTAPTSSVFELGNKEQVNGSGNNIIAYCFAEKKGYSKFGSYTGNGNADGAFIYTGFKPALFLMKETTDSGTNWIMYDNKRSTFNAVDDYLKPNSSDAESTGLDFDFLSNGIKCRNNNSGINASGQNYIFMAFAEEPLVANVGQSIPATAR